MARGPCVYILRCGDGTLYTGAAKNLPRRLAQHAAGRASRYTRARLPVILVWSRRARNWRAALRRERRIKALSRVEKDALILGTPRRTLARPRAVCDGSRRRLAMGRVAGDKSRYNRNRKEKLARRVAMRALAKTLQKEAASAAAPAASARRK